MGGMPAPETQPDDHCAERTAVVPRRTRTHARHRAARMATERRHNRQTRLGQHAGPAPPEADEDPPPC
ncbi:hypothetical protein MSAS_37150 [Mycobacterium saskatchewanense]|nr:hypothetical protein MSAS_37150 [Mycobacterium saskatchewanense]